MQFGGEIPTFGGTLCLLLHSTGSDNSLILFYQGTAVTFPEYRNLDTQHCKTRTSQMRSCCLFVKACNTCSKVQICVCGFILKDGKEVGV